MKASTHESGVGVDVAAGECDCAAVNRDAASQLPQQSTSVNASTPSGQWGGFMKVSAYCGLVVVDVAIVERDCATSDEDATSALPNNEARQ